MILLLAIFSYFQTIFIFSINSDNYPRSLAKNLNVKSISCISENLLPNTSAIILRYIKLMNGAYRK